MAYIIEDQLKEVVEEADREKALKEVAKVLTRVRLQRMPRRRQRQLRRPEHWRSRG